MLQPDLAGMIFTDVRRCPPSFAVRSNIPEYDRWGGSGVITPQSGRRRTRASGEGSVRRDKANARWVGTVTIGREDVSDGPGGVRPRQVRQSVSARTKREVVSRLRELQVKVDAGVPIASQTITVGAMLDQRLDHVIPATAAPATEEQYRHVVRLYVKPRLGRRTLRRLSPLDVTRMLRDVEQPTATRPNGYSANSRRLARSMLRRALRWAEVEGIVSRNVAALSNPVGVEQRDRRTLTPERAVGRVRRSGRWRGVAPQRLIEQLGRLGLAVRAGLHAGPVCH